MSPDSNTTIAESTTVSQEDVIPILDVGAYLRGDPGALDALAAELREAMENIGFYYLAGHDVPLELIHGIFGAAKQFHAQPLDAKMALKANEHNVGYMPVNGSVSRASQVEKAKKPNLVEAFFLKRDLPLDHPDVVSEKRYRCANQWPEAAAVPGFRATAVAYMDAMESLCKRMLPVYARAMDLPADWFDKPFDDPQYTLRLSHYPPSEVGDADQYGLAPHTDSSFLTMLAQADLPGLSIRMPDGRWVQLPVIEGRVCGEFPGICCAAGRTTVSCRRHTGRLTPIRAQIAMRCRSFSTRLSNTRWNAFPPAPMRIIRLSMKPFPIWIICCGSPGGKTTTMSAAKMVRKR